MSRSYLSQALQVAGSASYNDDVSSPHSQAVAEAQAVLEGDLNVIRTLLRDVVGETNWYDASPMSLSAIAGKHFIQRVTPAGFDNASSGTGSSTNGFDAAIKSVTDHNTGLGDSSTGGIVVNGTKAYRIAVRDADSKNPIDDGQGNEVYGRLSYSGSEYVLSWYSSQSGSEVAYTFASAIDIDVAFIAVSRRYEDLDWSQFIDPSWHDVAGLSGTLDDSNVTTGVWSYLLAGATTQQQANAIIDTLGQATTGKGANLVAIEDASGWFATTSVEGALNELEALLGSTSSAAFSFSESNVLADNDPVYAALNKLDLRFGDLESTNTNEGASLIGVADAGSFFTGATVEAVLQEIGQQIEDVAGWTKVTLTTTSPVSSGTNITIPASATYTVDGGANLDVYLDGQLLLEGAGNDYQEVSSTQIAPTFTIPTGKNITFMIRK